MYQLCRFPSRDVRFNVTLSPTSTDSEGPGMLRDVFVSPQPVVRLPYSWIGKSRAPAAGTAIPRDPRRRTASVAATRMRRFRVVICIPSVGGEIGRASCRERGEIRGAAGAVTERE